MKTTLKLESFANFWVERNICNNFIMILQKASKCIIFIFHYSNQIFYYFYIKESLNKVNNAQTLENPKSGASLMLSILE